MCIGQWATEWMIMHNTSTQASYTTCRLPKPHKNVTFIDDLFSSLSKTRCNKMYVLQRVNSKKWEALGHAMSSLWIKLDRLKERPEYIHSVNISVLEIKIVSSWLFVCIVQTFFRWRTQWPKLILCFCLASVGAEKRTSSITCPTVLWVTGRLRRGKWHLGRAKTMEH